MTIPEVAPALTPKVPSMIETHLEGGVAYILLANPPVNALTLALRNSLLSSLQIAQDDPSVKVICLRGQGGGFSTGLDPKEMTRLPSGANEASPTLQELCFAIENSSKPVVAALHGAVFEAGLALALAAHYRIIGPKSRVAAPEVTVGLVPGGGVTQRLPRLVGAAVSLEILLSGKAVMGSQTLALGLCDQVIDMRDQKGVTAYCADLVDRGAEVRRTSEVRNGFLDGASYMKNIAARRSTLSEMHLKAPQLIIDCVEAALLLPFDAGVRKEDAARLDVLGSAQMRAMSYAFFAEHRAAQPRGIDVSLARPVKKIGIAGVSNVALGIAKSALENGFEVVIFGSDANQVALAQGKITRSYDATLQQGGMSSAEHARCLARFQGASELESLKSCDMVIDATTGSVDRRAQILTRIEEFVAQNTILATISDHGFGSISQHLSHPDRFLGMHFFGMAHDVRVVELVKTDTVAPAAFATAYAVVRKLGKTPVSVTARDGLIANTVQSAVWAAVDVLLLMGVRPSQIDRAMENYGMSIGPCAHLDVLGLQNVSGAAATVLSDAGRHGRGGRGGFYDYILSEEGPKRQDDTQAMVLIDELRKGADIDRVMMSDAQVCDRIVLAQSNAGARALQAGVAARPVDIDTVMVLGKGYPRWRGGPMFAADVMRPLVVQKKLHQFAQEAPDIWDPSLLWGDLVRSGNDLKSLNNI